jgi:glucoside 3-dehydrogenase (cytochrome c) hitch-hiker subunit
MNRREIIKYAALATGAAISTPLLTSLLSGCQTDIVDNAEDYSPLSFSKEEFALLKNLVDVILPKTDSPSATGVGVHRMIDHMVSKVYNKEDQTAYQERFKKLVSHLAGTSGEETPDLNKLLQLDPSQKLALLKKIDSSEEEALKDIRKAYLDLKQQTVAYYLTTEEIAKNYLTYLPVPGNYEPCISVEAAGGKAWAI